MFDPDAAKPGGFSENDGTIDFYRRVRQFVRAESRVLDIGAGRGAWYEDDTNQTRRTIRYIAPGVAVYICADVDRAVLANRASTKNIVFDGKRVPLEDESLDLIIADYVLEHVDDPISFCNEISRLLKPGGTFCARTPHEFNYVSIGARLFANVQHATILKGVQPGRNSIDVFPTAYCMNRMSVIRKFFPTWANSSFVFRSDPAYYFGSKTMYKLFAFMHRVSPLWLVGNLFVFVTKPHIASGTVFTATGPVSGSNMCEASKQQRTGTQSRARLDQST